MEAGQQAWEEGFDQVEGRGFSGAQLERDSAEVNGFRAGYKNDVKRVMMGV